MIIVTWKTKNNMKLKVIDVYEGPGNETYLTVCKEFADPIMGRFGVRARDTSIEDYIVQELKSKK